MSRLTGGVAAGAWGIRSIDGYAPPDSLENRENLIRLSLRLGLPIVAVGMVAAVIIPAIAGEHEVKHTGTLVAVLVPFLALSPAYTLMWRTVPLALFQLNALVAVVGLSVVAYLAGPAISAEVGAVYAASTCLSLIAFTRRAAVCYVVVNAVGYAVVLATQHVADPFAKWFGVIGTMLIVGYAMDWLVERMRLLAERERAARTAFAELNATLEERVAQQVEEIGRVGRLRRFLSPQVADVVLSAGESSLLEPHRRQIAVFFCDLRGFTRFVGGSEPEEVVEILDDYYSAVGAVLNRYAATVGQFAGDGVMAYFNDPVPCEDPCARAVNMAVTLRASMHNVITAWSKRGFDLGIGMGIAYGYATLGTIGFEGRNDYTPVGSVVNLASRLCSEASNAEILIDQRAHDAVADSVTAAPIQLTVKGFEGPVTAFRVDDTTALRDLAPTGR